jgi:large subunit ribosomal protein L15
MLKLKHLTPLVKKRKRVGRGGNRGGTSGKGNKGQRARTSANVGIGFEGGQMPLIRRLPKRGFNNTRFQQETKIINLEQLDQVFAAGTRITKEVLIEKGLIKGARKFLLKILGNGTLSKKLIIHANAFSDKALEAIKNVGGEVHIIQES